MSEVLQIRCPVCGRLAPVSTWEKIANSDSNSLGLVQRFEGRGRIETVKRITEPEDLDWVYLDGFNEWLKREPAPFELVKGQLLKSFSLWLKHGWINEEDLRRLSLKRIVDLGDLVSISRLVITGKREVTTKVVEFEF